MTADFTARITEILRGQFPLNGNDVHAHVAALIAQAAEQHYRPRIETIEQLDALPVGVVVLDAELNVCERLGGWDEGLGGPCGLMWGTVGVAAPVIPELPVVVLWSPGADE